MHFIVLSLPLFPDQWSYCNLSRNFITVSEIEWLRRADTIEKDHHWNTAMPLLFTSPLPSLLCLQLHPNISPFVLTHSPYTQHSTLQTLHYTLTSDITRYWLLSKFITINTMEAMHIARRYSQPNYASNIEHTPYMYRWILRNYIKVHKLDMCTACTSSRYPQPPLHIHRALCRMHDRASKLSE